MNTITVYYNNNGLSVYAAVAESLGLKNGETIRTEKRFWEILTANCSHGISICESKLQSKPN